MSSVDGIINASPLSLIVPGFRVSSGYPCLEGNHVIVIVTMLKIANFLLDILCLSGTVNYAARQRESGFTPVLP
jgi:hypothetical protein